MTTKKVAMLYVGDYKSDEARTLQRAGVVTARWDGGSQVPDDVVAAAGHTWLLRTRRLAPIEFRGVYSRLAEFHVRLLTSPVAFEVIDDVELYYPPIANMSPRAIVTPADMSADELLASMFRAQISFPVFLRGDTESAAKYVGVDGCIIGSGDVDEVKRVVENLRKHVQGFRKIIVKENVKIKRAENGKLLEYRAIGIAGKLVTFDHDPELSKLPSPKLYGLPDAAAQALKQLASADANGAVFVDFAITESETPIIVECKDFSNGTVNFPLVFAASLLRFV